MAESSSPSRPRRSTRVPTKFRTDSDVPTEGPSTGKRKAQDVDQTPADKVEHLLTNSRSRLTRVDITNILNYTNFLDLSPESQARLASLLPPTSFQTFIPSIPPTHADYQLFQTTHPVADPAAMQVDSDDAPGPSTADVDRTPATLDPLTFNSPFLLSAARTFQDHLYTGWFGKKAQDDLTRYRQSVAEGSMHAEWKDEVWVRDHPVEENPQAFDLTDLAKRGLLKEGDILAYRRVFSHLKLVVEKDLLIDTIYDRTHTLCLLLPRGSERSLHPMLLTAEGEDIDTGDQILRMDDIRDPLALETGILDVDGRVARADRYSPDSGGGNAQSSTSSPTSSGAGTARPWKAFVVWRWREEMRNDIEAQFLQERGGRERMGTLLYLRASCA